MTKAAFDVELVDIERFSQNTGNITGLAFSRPELRNLISFLSRNKINITQKPTDSDCYIVPIPMVLSGTQVNKISLAEKLSRSIIPLMEKDSLIVLDGVKGSSVFAALAEQLERHVPGLTEGSQSSQHETKLLQVVDENKYQTFDEFLELPRVIIGSSKHDTKLVHEMYQTFCTGTLEVTSMQIMKVLTAVEHAPAQPERDIAPSIEDLVSEIKKKASAFRAPSILFAASLQNSEVEGDFEKLLYEFVVRSANECKKCDIKVLVQDDSPSKESFASIASVQIFSTVKSLKNVDIVVNCGIGDLDFEDCHLNENELVVMNVGKELELVLSQQELIQLQQNISESDENQSNRILVICNAYPSDDALYRNGFIHRRVRGYIEDGLAVDIFYQHEPASEPYRYVYDGVSVTVGNSTALYHYLGSHKYDAFLVHFPEPTRVEPLIQRRIREPIIVWIHGFEAEAWYRRWFNFIDSPDELRNILKKKDLYYTNQNEFLKRLTTTTDLNIFFVNVSHWFQTYIVEPDTGAVFHEDNAAVIPNLVDEFIFPYRAKNPEKRKRILSIRPFASRKYANDLSIKAILELAKRPYFEDLEFTICGEGRLFEDITNEIDGFSNVEIRREFFTQEEVSLLHAEHGVFLCPTRFDSQGVSMCEAMSSGLVAISSNTAAIPEYVHHLETGLLSDPESAVSIADNIERLYFNPELFLKLSKAGSRWMHDHCGRSATIGEEINLIRERIGQR